MKKIWSIAVFLLLSFSALSAYNLIELAVIEMDCNKLSKKHKHTTTEFLLSTKKKLGRYLCINLRDVLMPYIKQVPESERKRLIFVLENAKGESIAVSYFDFNPKTAPMLPKLIVKKAMGSVGDTIKIPEVKGQEGIVDVRYIEEEFAATILSRLRLQVKSISLKEKRRLFRQGTIVFPLDVGTERWLTGLTRIRVYMLKK